MDTAPRAEREIVLWNPPLLDPELGTRASPLADASRLLAGLVGRGCGRSASRRAARLRSSCIASRASGSTRSDGAAAGAVPRRIHAPAAPGDRATPRRGRAARRLRDGRARARDRRRRARLRDLGRVSRDGRVAAPAVGPGRAAATRGLAVLVASEDALDQFFMREPEALLERTVEAALIDHATPRILAPHVLAAAYEGPLSRRTRRRSGPRPSSSRRPSTSWRRRPRAGCGGPRHARRPRVAPLR